MFRSLFSISNCPCILLASSAEKTAAWPNESNNSPMRWIWYICWLVIELLSHILTKNRRKPSFMVECTTGPGDNHSVWAGSITFLKSSFFLYGVFWILAHLKLRAMVFTESSLRQPEITTFHDFLVIIQLRWPSQTDSDATNKPDTFFFEVNIKVGDSHFGAPVFVQIYLVYLPNDSVVAHLRCPLPMRLWMTMPLSFLVYDPDSLLGCVFCVGDSSPCAITIFVGRWTK